MTTRTTTITTTTDRPRLRRRLLAPALVATLLAGSACGDDEPAPSTSENGEPATAGADDAPEEGAAPDADGLLADAIARLGTDYDFESLLTTEAGESVAVTGSRVGTSAEYSVEAAGAVVDVVVVDGAVWVRQDGNDEWLPSGENPSGDPLDALRTPLSVTTDPLDPAVLRATYSGTSIGLRDADPVEVTITAGTDTLSFESAAGAGRLVTTLTRQNQPEPIVAPA